MKHTTRSRRRRHETPIPEAGAVVVTTRYGPGSWETRVVGGGQLGGWTIPATGRAEAQAAHRGAVRLVREVAAAVGPA